MTGPVVRTRTRRFIPAALIALALSAPALLPTALRAQASTEVWQVVFAIPGISGLPAVPTPDPGFIFPSGVSVVPATNLNGSPLPLAGDLVVADTWNNMVRAFDAATGVETLRIGSATSFDFDSPAQVKVDANGHLVVSDTYHNVVKVFNEDGTPDNLLLDGSGQPTNALGGFDWPKGIAMTPGTAIGVPDTGLIAIVSSGNFTKPTSVIDVQVFNSMLQPLFTFGGTATGNGNGQLHAPLAVAIDPATGNFLVTDTATGTTPAQVLAYSPTGTFLFSFTNPASDPTGPMNFPIDILVQPDDGRVLVADAGTSVIYFFSVDYTGQTAAEDFTISGSNTPIQFLSPGGLAFDANLRLIVSTGTYDPTYTFPDPSTQFVLVFDRPSLAIPHVAVTANGVPVTGAVTPGTTLDFTVTLHASSGTVSNVSVAATLTDLTGAPVSLGTQSPPGGDVTAGTDSTVTFSYQVPLDVTTAGTLSFSAQATGTVLSGSGTSQEVTATHLPVTVAVQPAGGDTTAPTVTAAPSPASPQAPPWYNTPVQIALTAVDEPGGSGVKEIQYYFTGQQSIVTPGSPFFPIVVSGATATATVNQDGTSTLYYRALDQAGNTSAWQSLVIQLDQSPPYVQKFTVSPAATGLQQIPGGTLRYWWNTNVGVAYTAQDALSGVKSATPPSPLTFTAEGVDQRHVVTLVDNADNTSADYSPQSYTSPAISLDKTAPVAGPIARTPAANANGWNNSAVTLTFTATDQLSGFPAADATTHIDGGLQASRFFTLGTEGKNQTVASQTFTDVAGNVSAPATYSSPINIDTTAPTLNIAVQPTQPATWTDPGGHVWYPAVVNVTFTATDALSGFANGTLTAISTVPVSDGANQIVTRTFADLAGNGVAGASPALYVDTLPPTITPTVTKSGGTETITFTASDAGSGLAGCTVSVNGTVVQETCDPYVATTADTGKVVTATAIDHVGHQATTAPITISFAPPEAYNQFDPVTRTVQVFAWDPTTGTATGPIAPVSSTREERDGVYCRDPRSGRWFGPFPKTWWHGKAVIRVYRIEDAGGNVLTLVEGVKTAGHDVHVEVLSVQYTVDGVTQPIIYPREATKHVEWALNRDGSLKELHQDFTIGTGRDKVEVQADYDGRKNRTTIAIKTRAPKDRRLTVNGLVLLQMLTNHDGSNLIIGSNTGAFEPVPGPPPETHGKPGHDDHGRDRDERDWWNW
ncbi:MAG: hypothetical protein KGN76_06445 [Acidobacteriota bacterium]|nr:hypothetical protein [Acidobacteriota bacterium]